MISLHLLPLLPSSHGNSYQITEPKTKINGEVCDQSSLYDFMNVLAIIVERYLLTKLITAELVLRVKLRKLLVGFFLLGRVT